MDPGKEFADEKQKKQEEEEARRKAIENRKKEAEQKRQLKAQEKELKKKERERKKNEPKTKQKKKSCKQIVSKPKTNVDGKSLCQVCMGGDMPGDGEFDWVGCDNHPTCDKWYHYRCLPSQEQTAVDLSFIVPDVHWKCPHCR